MNKPTTLDISVPDGLGLRAGEIFTVNGYGDPNLKFRVREVLEPVDYRCGPASCLPYGYAR